MTRFEVVPISPSRTDPARLDALSFPTGDDRGNTADEIG